ncbi:MAG: glucokinase [Bacteroidota bacterium]
MILAGDIGGTKTNLAYFSIKDGTLESHTLASYPSQQHGSLRDIVVRFIADNPAPVTASAFGIAGPVMNGRSEATNLPWIVDASELATALNLKHVSLLNDLSATAYGILRLSEKDKFMLNPGKAELHAPIAIIAAGTGLGEGGLVWNGTEYRTLASEGGHTDFAPRNELEMDLLRFLLKRYDRVSYERIISGPGLYNIYEFLRTRATSPEPQWLKDQIASGDPSAAVSRAATEQKDMVCADALEIFISLYGAEAGNLALKLLSTGGVYVAGGIAPKIITQIQQGSFMKSFAQKGRFTNLLKNMPVSIVLDDKAALLGAAHYALMEQKV